jgi:CO/xanthine dehydrogenase Mo-binding subunit
VVIAAEEPGLPMEAVHIVEHSDITTVPFDAPSHPSRVTCGAGLAMLAAAGGAWERLLEVAGITPEQMLAPLGKLWPARSHQASPGKLA